MKNTLADYAKIFAIFIASRVVLTMTGLMALSSLGEPTPMGIDRLEIAKNIVSLYVRWDSGWYLTIIEGGYQTFELPGQPGATNFEFFPLYPLMVSALQSFSGFSAPISGLLVSHMAFSWD